MQNIHIIFISNLLHHFDVIHGYCCLKRGGGGGGGTPNTFFSECTYFIACSIVPFREKKQYVQPNCCQVCYLDVDECISVFRQNDDVMKKKISLTLRVRLCLICEGRISVLKH